MSAAVAWACAQHAWIQACLRMINEDDATRDAVHGGIARRRLLHRQRKARAATDVARATNCEIIARKILRDL